MRDEIHRQIYPILTHRYDFHFVRDRRNYSIRNRIRNIAYTGPTRFGWSLVTHTSTAA